MGKGNKGKQVASASTATATTTATAKVAVLTVKAGQQFRGARQAWYTVLQQYNGKPAIDFLVATATTPPSLPKSGKQEKSTGWLRYFVRVGAASIQ